MYHRAIVSHLVVGAVIAASTGLQGAEATDYMWTGGGDGFSFGDPFNWLPVGVPAESDTAIFDLGFAVTMGGFVQNRRLDVGGSGTLDLLGGNYTLQGAPVTVEVDGSLGVSNGTLASDFEARIGGAGFLDVSVDNWEHRGFLTVDGTCQLTSTHLGSFGANVNGAMTVTDGSWSNNGFFVVSGSLALSSSAVAQEGGAVEIGAFGSMTIDNTSSLTCTEGLWMSGANGTSSLTVSNDSYMSATGLTAGTDPGTFNITVQNSSGLHVVGPFNGTYLATAPGSNVIVNVVGPFSSWLNARDLVISDGGSATFNVADGFVECEHGRIRPGVSETAAVTISGEMGGWVMSGEFDVGGGDGTTTVRIEDGAFVDCGAAFIGEEGTGPTTLTATGLDSEFFALGELNVGSGDVILSNGASMGSADAFIAADDVGSGSGSVTVTGAESMWLNPGQLIVGAVGDGGLAVTDSGVVLTGDAIVGLLPGAIGTVDVSGAGSMLTGFGDLNVARSGQGTMNIDLGAVVTSTNGYVGGFTGSDGNVTIDGSASSWDNLGFVTIGGNAGTGTVILSNGATLSAWQINVGANGSLIVAESANATTGQIVVAEGGIVSGTGTLTGDAFNAGVISPGLSVGTLAVEGDFGAEVTGTLAVELDEPASDLLAVTGDVTLGGALDVTLVSGYSPEPCDRFTILTGSSVTGTFDTVNLPPGVSEVYTPTSVDLIAVPPGYAAPESFNVQFGRLSSGEVSDLACSDDQRLIIDQRPSISVLLPVIRVAVNGTSPSSTATELTVTLEAHATSIPTLPPQRLSLRNYDTGLFEIVDERTATRSDSVVEVTITTNPQRFLENGTDAMQMRVEYFNPGNVFSPAWGCRIDQAVWIVTP